MKITQSQFVQQTASASKSNATAQEQPESLVQVDRYTPTKKAALWGYSANEVIAPVRNSFTHPDWEKIPTKGMPTPSQEELVAQIQDLARNMPDKETGTEQEWDTFWDKKYRLMTQYESAVSPDRKALHAQALKVAKKVEEEQPKDTRPLTLVDYLTIDDLNLTIDQVANYQNAIVTPIHKTGGGYEYEVSFGGERVMSSLNGRWYYARTDAEQLRIEEFERIFDAAQQQ